MSKEFTSVESLYPNLVKIAHSYEAKVESQDHENSGVGEVVQNAFMVTGLSYNLHPRQMDGWASSESSAK